MAESEPPEPGRDTTPRAVILDAGGTLIHMPRTAGEILVDLCLHLGFSVSPEQADAAYHASEQYYSQRYLSYTGDQGAFWHAYHSEALRFLGIDDPDGTRAEFLSHGYGAAATWVAYPEASATCQRLKEMGLRMAVISNGPVTVRNLLDQAGLLAYFEVVVTSQDLGIEKPDPRIFRATLDRLGVSAGQAIYVGDLYYVDVVGARSAGMTPVLIDRVGGQPRDCPVIHSLDELVPRVEELMR